MTQPNAATLIDTLKAAIEEVANDTRFHEVGEKGTRKYLVMASLRKGTEPVFVLSAYGDSHTEAGANALAWLVENQESVSGDLLLATMSEHVNFNFNTPEFDFLMTAVNTETDQPVRRVGEGLFESLANGTSKLDELLTSLM